MYTTFGYHAVKSETDLETFEENQRFYAQKLQDQLAIDVHG